MEWQANWEGPLQGYLQRFDGLLKDARTRRTFQESIKGIMAAGTLICQRIAVCSPLLSKAKDGAQRILRLATGESTKRSQVDAEHLTARPGTSSCARWRWSNWRRHPKTNSG